MDFPSLCPLFRRGVNEDGGCLDNNAHISLVLLLFPTIDRMDEDMKLDTVLLSCLIRELYGLERHPNYIGYGREQQIMLALLDYVYEYVNRALELLHIFISYPRGGENAFTALYYLLEWLEAPRENAGEPVVLNYTVCQKFFHACGTLVEWSETAFGRCKRWLLRRTILSLEKVASIWESLRFEVTTCFKRLRKVCTEVSHSWTLMTFTLRQLKRGEVKCLLLAGQVMKVHRVMLTTGRPYTLLRRMARSRT